MKLKKFIKYVRHVIIKAHPSSFIHKSPRHKMGAGNVNKWVTGKYLLLQSPQGQCCSTLLRQSLFTDLGQAIGPSTFWEFSRLHFLSLALLVFWVFTLMSPPLLSKNFTHCATFPHSFLFKYRKKEVSKDWKLQHTTILLQMLCSRSTTHPYFIREVRFSL